MARLLFHEDQVRRVTKAKDRSHKLHNLELGDEWLPPWRLVHDSQEEVEIHHNVKIACISIVSNSDHNNWVVFSDISFH